MGQEVKSVQEAFALEVIENAKKNLVSLKKNSSKTLYNSMRATVNDDGSITFYMEDYGIDVDQGRDGKNKKRRSPESMFYKGGNVPSFPNIKAISKWVNNKPVRPQGMGSTKMDLDDLTYVISRSIYLNGTKATLFFTNPFMNAKKGLTNKLAVAVAEDLATEFSKNIKNAKIQ